MFVVMFKNHGELMCEQQVFGPFVDFMDADNALSDGRVPTLYGQGGREWPLDVQTTEAQQDDLQNYPGWRYTMELTRV